MDDYSSLARELTQKIKGEVRFDDGARALYATDASNYREVPIGVVIPKNIDDLISTVSICRKYNVPVLSRGGGTSLAGQCCNVAVIMDFSKHINKVFHIDIENKLATVEPGCVLDHLQEAARPHKLIFGPDPATHTHNSLGGMIGNDSCGEHSLLSRFAGNGSRTADNIYELEILTYDGYRMRVGKTSSEELERIINEGGRRGKIYSKLKELRDKYADEIRKYFPNIPRRVSGYNLDQLLPENDFNVAAALVGSEGTCVTILEAIVKLVPNPNDRTLLALGYPDIYDAADEVPQILLHKPCALEGIDEILIHYMKKKNLHSEDLHLLPKANGWLIIEFGGQTEDEAKAKAEALIAECKKNNKLIDSRIYTKEEAKKVWLIRRSGLGATADIPGEPANWPGWEDSAVPPDKVGPYLRDLKKLFKEYDYEVAVYGHFGDGCIHCRIPFGLKTAAGIAKTRSFLTKAAELVVSYGGSLSGEHGDGQSRAQLLPIMFGNVLMQAFWEFKSIWDPLNKMNPGKKIHANPIMDQLRLGIDYNPWHPKTYFQFPKDKHSFAEASLRCVGVGECRRDKVGTMCPSFRATHEEKYSTRGRARLLFEMLQGQVIGKNKWKDPSVKDSLNYCLACKGCKHECPVNVDMATYKSEFLAHYYERKLRPRSAYIFGFIHWWSRLATHMPGFINFFTQTKGINQITKWIVGIHPKRHFPKYAKTNLKRQLHDRKNKAKSNQKVILWPDTFNNYFYPEVGIATFEVLEDAGFEVIIPDQFLCCGRPLYDFGFLNQAKRQLQIIINTLRPYIRDGIPVVGMEPSCVAVFRDELMNLLPYDEDAKRLSKQTYFFSEFLNKYAPEYKLSFVTGKAIIHGHCHHKALIKMEQDKKLFDKTSAEFMILDSGCCGMAGSFGFERDDRYDVSVKIGEQILFPAVRESDSQTTVITDGFSCKTQILSGTVKKSLHTAEFLRNSMRNKNDN